MLIRIDDRVPAHTFAKFPSGTARSCEGSLHLGPGKLLDVTPGEAAALKKAKILWTPVGPAPVEVAPAAALAPVEGVPVGLPGDPTNAVVATVATTDVPAVPEVTPALVAEVASAAAAGRNAGRRTGRIEPESA